MDALTRSVTPINPEKSNIDPSPVTKKQERADFLLDVPLMPQKSEGRSGRSCFSQLVSNGGKCVGKDGRSPDRLAVYLPPPLFHKREEMIGIVRSKRQESYLEKKTSSPRLNPPPDGGSKVRTISVSRHHARKRQNTTRDVT
jgi:hypothetical protein